MMEQHSDFAAAPGVPIVSLKLALSEEARASLEAVRVAQEGARRRARRQTVQARILFAALVGVVASTALAFGPRLGRRRHAPAEGSAAASTPLVSPEAVGAASAAQAAAAEPDPPLALAEVHAPAAVPAVAAPGADRAETAAGEGCDTAAIRSAPWRLSPEACVKAFEADPRNASLALAVAQAEHAHGRIAESARWARRALALDPQAAEGYVIVARAEMGSHHPEEARAAYRRYLELAPRGWHRAEARGALRRTASAVR